MFDNCILDFITEIISKFVWKSLKLFNFENDLFLFYDLNLPFSHFYFVLRIVAVIISYYSCNLSLIFNFS